MAAVLSRLSDSMAGPIGGRVSVRGAIVLRRLSVPLVLISALAFLLRLYDLGENGFSLDEVTSIWMARFPAGEIVRRILFEGGDATPPTYYLILHAFLRFGESPLIVRAPTMVAGVLMVWVTYALAAEQFGGRVAAVAALLLALSPLHIAISRTARAYALSALLVTVSLYFLSRLLFARPRRVDWVGFVVATIAALYVHYLSFVVLPFANAWVFVAWRTGNLSSRWLRRWVTAQLLIGLALVPTVMEIRAVQQGTGQDWLGRTTALAVAKSIILFVAGNPSYGPTGVTHLRVLVVLVIVGVGLLGLLTLAERRDPAVEWKEGQRLAFMAGAFLVPWVSALAIGAIRPIYAEKYFLFLLPPLFILMGWIFVHSSRRLAGWVLFAVLIGLTVRSVAVYHTQPYSDQFREAVAYARPTLAPGDAVVLSPAFFYRPYSYYLDGSIPDLPANVRHAAAVVVDGGRYEPIRGADDADRPMQPVDALLASGGRVWVFSGGDDAPAAPKLLAWISDNFTLADERRFKGATVRVWERPKQGS